MTSESFKITYSANRTKAIKVDSPGVVTFSMFSDNLTSAAKVNLYTSNFADIDKAIPYSQLTSITTTNEGHHYTLRDVNSLYLIVEVDYQSSIAGEVTFNLNFIPEQSFFLDKSNSLTTPSYTKITSPISAFGELITAKNTAFIQNTGVYELMPSNFREYTSFSGTTGITDRMFTATCGTTIYGYGAIQSFRSLNYNAGQSGMARFTALFQNSVANHWSGVGLVNLSDELSFGYNGTAFGIWHRKEGVAEVRTITVTGASGGSTDLTLTLNTVAYTIPLTAGTTAHNAYQIAAWLNANQSVWDADQIGSTVIISALSDGAKSGTYTYSHATSTGTITQNKAGVTKTSTHIPQEDWNRDIASWIDPTKGNVYQIIYPYLGFGDIEFYVKSTDDKGWLLVHVIEYQNVNTKPSVRQPSLRFGIYSASVGSTTDVTVQCASVALFVIGDVFKTRNPRAVKNTQSVTTSFTNVLTLRNRKTYNYIYNQVEIEPISLSMASESSKNVEIEIRTNPVFSGDTNFTNVGTNLVGDVDTTANTYSNGTLLAAFTLSGNGNREINLDSFNIRIPPSLQVCIGARVTSGAAANITAALTYYEDL